MLGGRGEGELPLVGGDFDCLVAVAALADQPVD